MSELGDAIYTFVKGNTHVLEVSQANFSQIPQILADPNEKVFMPFAEIKASQIVFYSFFDAAQIAKIVDEALKYPIILVDDLHAIGQGNHGSSIVNYLSTGKIITYNQ